MIVLWELIIILVTIVFIAYIVNKIEATKKEINSRMSFKEALDLIELPIVTFYQGDKKLNFMLDSGSNFSIIDINAVNNLKLKHTKLNKVNSIIGINGETRNAGFINLKFSYKHINFDYDFQYLDLSNVVDSLKQNGITIHGILGNQFFIKYKYILDFNDLIAYSKK